MVAREMGTIGRVADMRGNVSLRKLAGAGLLTTGRIFLLKDKDDLDRREVQDSFPAGRVFDGDIEGIMPAVRTGANDYILVCMKDDNEAWDFSTDIQTISKRNVHIVGVGNVGRVPITGSNTSTTSGTIGFTADGAELANVRIAGSAGNKVSVSFSSAADRGWLHDCEIVAPSATAVFDVAIYGDTYTIQRCTIGDTVQNDVNNYFPIDTASSTSGLVLVEDCVMMMDATHSSAAFVNVQASFTANGDLIMRRCQCYNVGGTAALGGVNAANGKIVMMDHCAFEGATTAGHATYGFIAPAGIGMAVTDANVFNPALMIDGAAELAVDTPP